jgi:atrial natriuretic peptide receptor A
MFVADQGPYWSDHDWQVGDRQDHTAKKAYEALLRVSLLTPTSPKFQEFADNVRRLAQRDYNYTFSEGEEVQDLFVLTLWNHSIAVVSKPEFI